MPLIQPTMAALHPAFLYIVVAAVVAVVLKRAKRRVASALPLPPGPPRLPIIGNALDLPKHDMHEKFRDMCTKYGELRLSHSLYYSPALVWHGSVC